MEPGACNHYLDDHVDSFCANDDDDDTCSDNDDGYVDSYSDSDDDDSEDNDYDGEWSSAFGQFGCRTMFSVKVKVHQ